MITLSIVAIGLSAGLIILVGEAYGQTNNMTEELRQIQSKKIVTDRTLDYLAKVEGIVNYCYEHASDSPNPVKDLVDKGLMDQQFANETCGSLKKIDDQFADISEYRYFSNMSAYYEYLNGSMTPESNDTVGFSPLTE